GHSGTIRTFGSSLRPADSFHPTLAGFHSSARQSPDKCHPWVSATAARRQRKQACGIDRPSNRLPLFPSGQCSANLRDEPTPAIFGQAAGSARDYLAARTVLLRSEE